MANIGFADNNKILVDSLATSYERAPIGVFGTSNKVDLDILPGHLLEEFKAGPTGNQRLSVRRQNTANAAGPILLAIPNTQFGGDADADGEDYAKYSAPASASAADFPKGSTVRYAAPKKGDVVRVRVGTADAIVIGDALAAVADTTTDGQHTVGCVGKQSGSNPILFYAMEDKDQTNAYDQELILARVA